LCSQKKNHLREMCKGFSPLNFKTRPSKIFVRARRKLTMVREKISYLAGGYASEEIQIKYEENTSLMQGENRTVC